MLWASTHGALYTSSVVQAPVQTHVRDIPTLTHRRWDEIGRGQSAAMLSLLRGLDAADWERPTECEPWSVRDMVAHMIGWMEATTDPVVWGKQAVGTTRIKKEMGGLRLDAANEYQIRIRRDLSTADLIARFEKGSRRFQMLRSVLGRAGVVIPFKEPFAGHWVTIGYLAERVFSRDQFMHRIDISRALDRDVPVHATDKDLIADVVKEWAKRSHADALVRLAGEAGGGFILGYGGRSTIDAPVYEFCRQLAGRPSDALVLGGDEEAARTWLSVLCTF